MATFWRLFRIWQITTSIGLAAVVALLVIMLSEQVDTSTRYVATIRVDGREYTSDVVQRVYRTWQPLSYTGDKVRTSTHGRVLTFRLSDDRVVVVPVNKRTAERQSRTSRLGKQFVPGKGRRASNNWLKQSPDGYIFDRATNPTRVYAFQFRPNDPSFAPSMQAKMKFVKVDVPVIDLAIEVVSLDIRRPWPWQAERDTLERDFPGYRETRKSTSDTAAANPALYWVGNEVRLPHLTER